MSDEPLWLPDELLPGFVAARLPARPWPAARVPTGWPEPVLTLVRREAAPPGVRGTVVHLHGYNDYFFHEHLAAAVEEAGWGFVAVDARRAGRSLQPGEEPHYVDDVREQGSDLGATVAWARRRSPGLPVVVHAHSMGGLVAALWAHAHRAGGGCDALVLDAPFFAPTGAWLPPDTVLRALGRTAPLSVVASEPSQYAHHLLASNGGRWSFDTALKRPEGVPVRAGWLAAARTAQARVARGLQIACPVLSVFSASAGADRADDPGLDSTDTVIDVRTSARASLGLGEDVTVRTVPGAVHDLSLSTDEPRAAYLRGVLAFLDERLPGPTGRRVPA